VRGCSILVCVRDIMILLRFLGGVGVRSMIDDGFGWILLCDDGAKGTEGFAVLAFEYVQMMHCELAFRANWQDLQSM
jgi:hypothetical protein